MTDATIVGTRVGVSDAVSRVSTELFIDGEWVESTTGERFEVVAPATEEVIATVANGNADDARRAVETCARVQKHWAKTAPRERSVILRRAYELILERQDEFATIMTTEMGKPFAEAKGEVAYAAEFFRWFSEEAVRIGGDVTSTGDGTTRILVSKEPVGPCVLVTPWNFPLAMGPRKIGPAIAAGCTIVFKPSELTPLTSLALVDVLVEAGVPKGVLNVVPTTAPGEVVSTWMSSGIARKISFTGSTAVGIRLLEQASQHVMRSSMELAEMPRSSYSRTPISTGPSTARSPRRCATWVRPAPPRTASSCTARSPIGSPRSSLPVWMPSPSGTAWSRAPKSVRWSRRRL